MATPFFQRTIAFIFASVVLTICGGCSGRVAPGTPSNETSLVADQNAREGHIESEERVTQQDHLVMETVLLDLLANEEFFTEMNLHWGEENEIILGAKTGGDSFYLRQNQIEGELDEGQVIPQDLGDELRRRNKVGVPLEGFAPDDPGILVSDLSELPDGTAFAEAFVTRFPKAKAYVEAWLPAYSKDGTTALVRFWFGPTPHGAAGTYLLIKESDQWKVQWRSLAYFA